MTITWRRYKSANDAIHSAVIQRTVDALGDYSAGCRPVLDTGRVFTVKWEQPTSF